MEKSQIGFVVINLSRRGISCSPVSLRGRAKAGRNLKKIYSLIFQALMGVHFGALEGPPSSTFGPLVPLSLKCPPSSTSGPWPEAWDPPPPVPPPPADELSIPNQAPLPSRPAAEYLAKSTPRCDYILSHMILHCHILMRPYESQCIIDSLYQRVIRYVTHMLRVLRAAGKFL